MQIRLVQLRPVGNGLVDHEGSLRAETTDGPYGKSQAMKLTAPMAIPTPKTMPASVRFDSPSPNANMRPPTTMATRLSPRAIVPVNAVWRTLTAFSQGESA